MKLGVACSVVNPYPVDLGVRTFSSLTLKQWLHIVNHLRI